MDPNHAEAACHPSADTLTATYTACPTLAALSDLGTAPCGGGYVPSVRCRTRFGRGKRRRTVRRLLAWLADAYDRHQADRGDPRRAFRC